MTTLSSNLPAGNIQVLRQEGHLFTITEEQRDSANEWFYWKFKVDFTESGTYTFRFTRPNKVGTRSAAVSLDRGATWKWLAQEHYPDTQQFSYTCTTSGEVWFCQAIPYLQGEFQLFASEFSEHPDFQLSTLCHSRKGRPVELVTIGHGETTLLMTSRHHCQEMAATHALEGVMRAVLADDDFGQHFRSQYRLLVVPFVDKDGVEDGDQGKGRVPRDHGRDYYGEALYPETGAIRQLIENERPLLILDLHCPWLRNGITNEQSYLVENSIERFQPEIRRFAQLLEANRVPCAPFSARHTMRWGTGWNKGSNSGSGAGFGQPLAVGCGHLPFVKLATTIEIPFANFGEQTMTRHEFLQYGKTIARTADDYLQLAFMTPVQTRATLCFTGDIMSQLELDAACAKADGSYDYHQVLERIVPTLKQADYTIGNLETTFSGSEAGPSQLYSFNTPDAFAEALAEAGFSLLSTANNHCLDRGVSGLMRTLDILDQLDLEHTGTARSPEERDKPFVRYINGIKFGFVSSTYGTNAFANHTFLKDEEEFAVNLSQPQETLPGAIHLLDSMETIRQNCAANPTGDAVQLQQLRQAIQRTRDAGAEYIVALMHSGGQYNPQPDAYTEHLVEQLIQFGADMIIGNHPHVIQRFAWHKGHPVFYCLGNLITTPSQSPVQQAHPECHNSVLVKPTFTRSKDGVVTMTSATFRILRSIQLPNGVTSVAPLYDLLEASTNPAEKKQLAEEMARSVRTLLNLPDAATIMPKPDYELVVG